MKSEVVDMSRIENVLLEFNTLRVREIMKLMDWTWAISGGVPSATHIEECGRRLLTDVLTGDSYSVSTGGLRATYLKKSDCLMLEFIPTFSASDYDPGKDEYYTTGGFR